MPPPEIRGKVEIVNEIQHFQTSSTHKKMKFKIRFSIISNFPNRQSCIQAVKMFLIHNTLLTVWQLVQIYNLSQHTPTLFQSDRKKCSLQWPRKLFLLRKPMVSFLLKCPQASFPPTVERKTNKLDNIGVKHLLSEMLGTGSVSDLRDFIEIQKIQKCY